MLVLFSSLMPKTRIKAAPPRIPTADSRRVQPPPKTVDPFYLSKEWRALMARIIAIRGRRCQDPEHRGPHEPTARIFGDHIRELRDGGEPLDERNVMLRCGACHTRKTLQARAQRLRQ